MSLTHIFRAFALLCLILFSLSCEHKKELVNESVAVSSTEPSKFVLPPLPDTVFFCGKAIEISDFDTRERLDKELVINAFYHSSTIFGLKRAHRYFDQIERILKQQNVPTDFKYLCLIESNLTQAVSPAGAKGFWQFMPKTAQEYGLRVDKEVDERLHIEKSTGAACEYLQESYSRFNDWTLVAASYNMGMGGVKEALENQGVDNFLDLQLNNETSRYIFRILALKLIFENPEAYGYFPKELELYEPIKTRTVEITESITNLMDWSREQGTTYRMLKLLNPWIVNNNLTIKGESLFIEIPA